MKAKIESHYDKNRVELYKVLPLDTPFTIIIQSSTVCNIKCKYCFNSLDKEVKKDKGFESKIMDFDLFLNILEQMKQFPNRIKSISFVGMGEPLCNSNLPKMIKLIKEADIVDRISFFTNGLLLNQEMALSLIDAGLDELRISLQGMTAEKYEEICGVKVEFSQIVNNIKYFYQHKKQCVLHVKVADIALEDGEQDKFYKTFENICDSMFIEHIVPMFEDIDYGDIIDKNLEINRFNEKTINFDVCSISFYMLNIDVNGNVIPCCDYFKPIIGNVNQESLLDIWNGETRLEFLRMQLCKEKSKISVCKKCHALNENFHREDNIDNYTEEVLDRLEKYNKKIINDNNKK